jgi:hypothetical protein
MLARLRQQRLSFQKSGGPQANRPGPAQKLQQLLIYYQLEEEEDDD